MLFPSQLLATDYKAWIDPNQTSISAENTEVAKLLRELLALVNDADRAKAADPRFLNDLRQLINLYDWPWSKVIIDEDFTDGRVAADPKWEVIAGEFRAEVGRGLTSKVTSAQPSQSTNLSEQEDLALLLLEQLLKGSSNEKAATAPIPPEAKVHTETTISNAFAITANIDRYSESSHLRFGVYRGINKESGYQIVYRSGIQDEIELTRLLPQNKTVIARSSLSASKHKRTFQWTRDRNGNMRLKVDGKLILEVRDLSLRQSFNGFLLANRGGEFAITTLTINCTPN